eukprot:scaffold90105_cov36-Phaeocystis_antarctica.AAC.1
MPRSGGGAYWKRSAASAVHAGGHTAALERPYHTGSCSSSHTAAAAGCAAAGCAAAGVGSGVGSGVGGGVGSGVGTAVGSAVGTAV